MGHLPDAEELTAPALTDLMWAHDISDATGPDKHMAISVWQHLNLVSSFLLVDPDYVASAGNPALGSTWNRFSTITAALAACTGGETIYIAPGIYSESVTVADDGVKLIGAGAPRYDSGTGRLVGGTIIRGSISLGVTVGIEISDLGIDLYGVDGTNCINATTSGINAYRSFHNLTLLGNGVAAAAHGIYAAGHYHQIRNIRIFNCNHGIAVHGSYVNISDIYLYSCGGSAIIVKAKSSINCIHVNIANVVLEGNPASSSLRSGAIYFQTEDSCEVRRCNVSNVTARYCVNGVVNLTRNDLTGTISEISFTNIASDGNLNLSAVGDYWIKSGNNIIFSNCRSTNRAGIAFNVDPADNVGDVYVYGSYADAASSTWSSGTFKDARINGTGTVVATSVLSDVYRSVAVTLADDTMYDYVITTQGMLMVSVGSGTFSATAYLLASFRARATPVCQSISIGSAVTVGTTALTGTFGTDGKMNIACTDGHIYIENRLGASISFRLFLMA